MQKMRKIHHGTAHFCALLIIIPLGVLALFLSVSNANGSDLTESQTHASCAAVNGLLAAKSGNLLVADRYATEAQRHAQASGKDAQSIGTYLAALQMLHNTDQLTWVQIVEYARTCDHL